jgi:hypothetical protein
VLSVDPQALTTATKAAIETRDIVFLIIFTLPLDVQTIIIVQFHLPLPNFRRARNRFPITPFTFPPQLRGNPNIPFLPNRRERCVAKGLE